MSTRPPIKVPDGFWLNKILSTPTVGIRFDPSYKSSGLLLDEIAPLIDSWLAKGWEPSVAAPSPVSVNLGSSKGGFTLAITQTDISLSFAYSAELEDRSREGPVANIHRPVEQFTRLLDEAAETLVEALAVLFKGKWRERPLSRIGIVAMGRLDKDSLPPGIDMFLKHLGKPWREGLSRVGGAITGELESGQGYRDVCHHGVNADMRTSDALVAINLDWQRYFVPSVAFQPGNRNSIDRLYDCLSKAIQYYETFALGDLNYADEH